ncbi:MAG: NAD(P)-binding protein, partial [Thermoanaerobaculia bacterium]
GEEGQNLEQCHDGPILCPTSDDMTTYDTIIVGGGPAGLTAAIHLAWHNRPVLVIDRRTGPLFFTLEKLYNVPGMPECKGIELQRGLRRQAVVD